MRTGNTLTILCVGCVCLALATASRADFVGAVSEFMTDSATCNQGGGDLVPLPLTVCNVFIQFNEDDDRLLAVISADLQVMDGNVPGVFFQHIFGADTPYCCFLLACDLFHMECDSYVTIGEWCVGYGSSTTDREFDTDEFNTNGHIIGGWFNNSPSEGLGDAASHADGQVPILRSSVAVGLRLEGLATVLWQEIGDPTVFENVVDIVCQAQCPDDCPADADGDGDTGQLDLAALLSAWGPTFPGACLDTNDDGQVDAFDLATLLATWGPCP